MFCPALSIEVFGLFVKVFYHFNKKIFYNIEFYIH
jgi:hypothetical protein